MLGAALYLSQGEETNLKILKQLNERAVKTVFTSLHIPEEDANHTLVGLKTITKAINKYKMDLMIDVSAGTLEQYHIDRSDAIGFFKSLGATTLRVDYGFSYQEIKQLSEQFRIVLNASTVTEESCDELEKVGMTLTDLTVCHNYYPREHTGLAPDFFLKRNQYLKEKGFMIQAFIPGDWKKRGPVFAGLPTLEDHREVDPLLAYVELKTVYFVDEVLIGDVLMQEQTLDRMIQWKDEQIVSLPITDTAEQLPDHFYDVQQNRKDVARDVIRSEASRVLLKGQSVVPLTAKARPLGTITLDNDLYGRYAGELQITKTNLPADERVNRLARVQAASLGLLHYVGSGTKFQFMEESV
ncbi:MupG family TIM beta-alpha barrel fold protein [Marinilactibacillus kalidii]|uniref:MupG family TIM beta-alpha barrel fold protein n=1 Tax=Marinilactibacillus kalidii TaxID=2820274 RepID=UPI001FC988A9|nr:MupG family TIM beta-alpha barrel fold protein [Marinilactibacillus kalidii]